MSAPEILRFAGRDLRMFVDDGEPRWIAKDVCDVLGLGNPSMGCSRLDEDEKGISTVDTPSGPQEMLHVYEPGLYSLILRSRKEEAKIFKRWITHEVLPSIRKRGSYGAPSIDVQALATAVATAVGAAIAPLVERLSARSLPAAVGPTGPAPEEESSESRTPHSMERRFRKFAIWLCSDRGSQEKSVVLAWGSEVAGCSTMTAGRYLAKLVSFSGPLELVQDPWGRPLVRLRERPG